MNQECTLGVPPYTHTHTHTVHGRNRRPPRHFEPSRPVRSVFPLWSALHPNTLPETVAKQRGVFLLKHAEQQGECSFGLLSAVSFCHFLALGRFFSDSDPLIQFGTENEDWRVSGAPSPGDGLKGSKRAECSVTRKEYLNLHTSQRVALDPRFMEIDIPRTRLRPGGFS